MPASLASTLKTVQVPPIAPENQQKACTAFHSQNKRKKWKASNTQKNQPRHPTSTPHLDDFVEKFLAPTVGPNKGRRIPKPKKEMTTRTNRKTEWLSVEKWMRTNRKTERSSAEKRVRMERKPEWSFSDRRRGTRGRQSDCALRSERGARKRRNDVSGCCKRNQWTNAILFLERT